MMGLRYEPSPQSGLQGNENDVFFAGFLVLVEAIVCTVNSSLKNYGYATERIFGFERGATREHIPRDL
jgi:hypothetical protein